jgi:hypothetical protein
MLDQCYLVTVILPPHEAPDRNDYTTRTGAFKGDAQASAMLGAVTRI